MKQTIAMCAVAVALAACGDNTITTNESETSSQNSKEIFGGFDAQSKNLDAIGTIGTVDNGQFTFFCTATLISPDTVLTARSCAAVTDPNSLLYGMKYVNLIPMYFAVGPDANDPAKVVEAIAADLSPLNEGGTMGFGNDVAVYHLIEPIVDVDPINVGEAKITASDLNKSLAMAGFGSRDNYEDLSGLLSATRQGGRATVRAIDGLYYEGVFGSYDKFFDAMADYYGYQTATDYEYVLQDWYSGTELLSGSEIVMGNVNGDAQACYGDTGGPVLGRENGEKRIFGVISSMLYSSQATCAYGETVAVFNDRTQRFLNESLRYNDPCAGGLTAQGYCDGDVAIRCTDKWEGDRARTEIDCSFLDQTCTVGASGRVGCGDSDEPSVHPPAPTVAEIRASIVKASRRTLGE